MMKILKRLKTESCNTFLISEQGPMVHKSNYLAKILLIMDIGDFF